MPKSKKLSEKVIKACHIPRKGHEILVKSSAIGSFPECFVPNRDFSDASKKKGSSGWQQVKNEWWLSLAKPKRVERGEPKNAEEQMAQG